MIQKQLRAWQTIARETILHPNQYLKVESHTVKLPDGRVIPDWLWVVIPSAVIVLPMTSEQMFLCFRQTKYAIEGTSLAPVGGMLELDETPIEAARRELLEEMGCVSSDWVDLGSYILDPNRGIATSHLFLALNVEQRASPLSDDLEDQELLYLNRSEIEMALRAGEFKAIAWTAAVSLALNYLNSTKRQ